MKRMHGERLPDDLHEVAERLRAHKPEVSPLELDRIKLRAMAKASSAGASRQGRPSLMRSKLVTMAVTLGLVVSGGTAGVIAGGKHEGNGNGNNGNNGNADKGEYCDGKNGKKGSHVSNCPRPPQCGSHGSQCKSNGSHNNRGSHNSH
jgi:hypothetical protein